MRSCHSPPPSKLLALFYTLTSSIRTSTFLSTSSTHLQPTISPPSRHLLATFSPPSLLFKATSDPLYVHLCSPLELRSKARPLALFPAHFINRDLDAAVKRLLLQHQSELHSRTDPALTPLSRGAYPDNIPTPLAAFCKVPEAQHRHQPRFLKHRHLSALQKLSPSAVAIFIPPYLQYHPS